MATIIKDISAESNSLVSAVDGFDSTTGGLAITTTTPPRGTRAFNAAGTGAAAVFGSEGITPVDELVVVLYFRANSVGVGTAGRMLHLQNASAAGAGVQLRESGGAYQARLVDSSGAIVAAGTATIALNTAYKLMIRQKKETSTGAADGVLEYWNPIAVASNFSGTPDYAAGIGTPGKAYATQTQTVQAGVNTTFLTANLTYDLTLYDGVPVPAGSATVVAGATQSVRTSQTINRTIVANLTGDLTNLTATCQYRVVGAGSWTTAYAVLDKAAGTAALGHQRTEQAIAFTYTGIVALTPATNYEAQLTLSNPNGITGGNNLAGPNSHVFSFTFSTLSRNWIDATPAPKRALYLFKGFNYAILGGVARAPYSTANQTWAAMDSIIWTRGDEVNAAGARGSGAILGLYTLSNEIYDDAHTTVANGGTGTSTDVAPVSGRNTWAWDLAHRAAWQALPEGSWVHKPGTAGTSPADRYVSADGHWEADPGDPYVRDLAYRQLIDQEMDLLSDAVSAIQRYDYHWLDNTGAHTGHYDSLEYGVRSAAPTSPYLLAECGYLDYLRYSGAFVLGNAVWSTTDSIPVIAAHLDGIHLEEGLKKYSQVNSEQWDTVSTPSSPAQNSVYAKLQAIQAIAALTNIKLLQLVANLAPSSGSGTGGTLAQQYLDWAVAHFHMAQGASAKRHEFYGGSGANGWLNWQDSPVYDRRLGTATGNYSQELGIDILRIDGGAGSFFDNPTGGALSNANRTLLARSSDYAAALPTYSGTIAATMPVQIAALVGGFDPTGGLTEIDISDGAFSVPQLKRGGGDVDVVVIVPTPRFTAACVALVNGSVRTATLLTSTRLKVHVLAGDYPAGAGLYGLYVTVKG